MNINNDISENYVSIEVAKLLKQKGFHVPTIYHYGETNDYVSIGSDIPATDWNKIRDEYLEEVNLYSRPTQTVAIEWLRVNFGFYLIGNFDNDDPNNIIYTTVVYDLTKEFSVYKTKGFHNPKEATDKGLEYVLNKIQHEKIK